MGHHQAFPLASTRLPPRPSCRRRPFCPAGSSYSVPPLPVFHRSTQKDIRKGIQPSDNRVSETERVMVTTCCLSFSQGNTLSPSGRRHASDLAVVSFALIPRNMLRVATYPQLQLWEKRFGVSCNQRVKSLGSRQFNRGTYTRQYSRYCRERCWAHANITTKAWRCQKGTGGSWVRSQPM